jgi:hypothetical protein
MFISLAFTVKEIFEVEEKPFTSSLHIGPEACCKGNRGRRSNTSPLIITLFPGCSVDILFKNSVIAFLFLGVYFTACTLHNKAYEEQLYK